MIQALNANTYLILHVIPVKCTCEGIYLLLPADEFCPSFGLRGFNPGCDWSGPDQPVHVLGFCFALDRRLSQGFEFKEIPGQFEGVFRYQNSARSRSALHASGQIGGVSNGGIIHPEIISDGAHNHRTGVEPDAQLNPPLPGRTPAGSALTG
jgi:hypothetical protein